MSNKIEIPNNYTGKSAEEIWNSWSRSQRIHFVRDHWDKIGHGAWGSAYDYALYAETDFDDISFDIKHQLKFHVMEGQYEQGGDTGKSIEDGVKKLMDSLKENGSTKRLITASNGNRIREVIQKNKKDDGYSRYHLPANGNKAASVKQNAYLTEDEVKTHFAKSIKAERELRADKFSEGGNLSSKYYLVVDLDERGEYAATIYDSNDKQVLDFSTSSVNDLIESGFLKRKPDADLHRLTKFLADNKQIPEGTEILHEKDFEKLKEKANAWRDDVIEYTIPNWALSYLINGDASGLSDEDEEKVKAFVSKVSDEFGNAHFFMSNEDEDDLGFTWRNNIDGSLGADCHRLYIRPDADKMAKGGTVKMKHPKDHYKKIKHNGYIWRGFINGKHVFTKYVPGKGYKEIKATEDDLTNGNIEFMTEHDLSNENKLADGGYTSVGESQSSSTFGDSAWMGILGN